jgi:putative ABC transport system ATP-binding protein
VVAAVASVAAVAASAVAAAASGVEMMKGIPMTHPVIRTEGVRKVYTMGDNEVHALRGVDLTVEAGEMIAVMGASGSGKSTLMNIIGCLDLPNAGAYFLDGIRVDGLDKDQLADIRNQKIGFVFQGFNLLARTSALENVELPLLYDRMHRFKNTKEQAARALERVGLGSRMDHHPSELSGGQQQRVAIARALATEPSLILADEPTGNLDSRTSIEVMSLFQELNDEGVTVLLVTHEHDIAQYHKRLVEFRDGKILRDEPVLKRLVATEQLAALDALPQLEGVA